MASSRTAIHRTSRGCRPPASRRSATGCARPAISTHYFGKWHISNPPDHSLDAYGFDNWEQSYPEPHGAQYNNLGIYRDAGFSDAVCTFIRRQALALNYDRVVAEAAAADPTAPAPSATEDQTMVRGGLLRQPA
jgi:hypothetical protein